MVVGKGEGRGRREMGGGKGEYGRFYLFGRRGGRHLEGLIVRVARGGGAVEGASEWESPAGGK